MAMQGCKTAAVEPASLDAATALFHSLSDTNRLAILRRLALGEARVVDLTTELGLAQSTVSAHLACLRDCGLVDYRPQGRASVYRLTRVELLDLFKAAEAVLEATGSAVALCPHYGQPTAGAVAQ
ncbi:ArsR family transcriptional regulator (plasmid) [Mycobacterium paragordonae]|uniref:Transcriptional regulator, ArsR family protein n=2 Tax=Mycobacterium paragordonae TaxID=1389713 RepID=A0ABQ1CFP4_9MYCO|nr:ArsR family transcriptional regulator [Mycobacterium paragordonae]RUP05547.1 MAG: ArsR family transcriptional regulator [Mycobacterium sp.]GFG82998.1 putative transcriptional regulator, ArsR family protein [Mycobacterium paragordonae]